MSGLLKTVSSLGQNFFACLPATSGREAFAVLEKPGGLPTMRVGAESPVAWLPASTKRGGGLYQEGGAGIIRWGVGWVIESGFFGLSESSYFLCRTALAKHALQV